MRVESRAVLLEMIEVRADARVRVRLRGELDLDELECVDMSGQRALLLAAECAADERLTDTVTRGSRAVRRHIALVHVDGQLRVDGTST